MKYAAYAAILIIVGWTGLALAQLWFQPLDAAIFFKITITCGLGMVATILAALIYREYRNDTVLKDRKYID